MFVRLRIPPIADAADPDDSPLRQPFEDASARWLLVDTRPGPIARACSLPFKLNHELGSAPVINLRFHWVKLPGDLEVALDWLGALDALNGRELVRFGLAPFATITDMAWKWDDGRPGGDGYWPVRCVGSAEREALHSRLARVLEQAYDDDVHLLLMPELMVDEAALGFVSEWLCANNLYDPRIRLVLAGTRHVDASAGQFANQATVLGLDGSVLWRQDKAARFRLPSADFQTPFNECEGPGLFEPTQLARVLTLQDSVLGRVLVSVCIDLLEDRHVLDLGVDLHLVPALSAGLTRFADRARALGGHRGAATLVINADCDGPVDQRLHVYLPKRKPTKPSDQGNNLFIIDIHIGVNI